MGFEETMESIGKAIDVIGVFVIVAGALLSAAAAGRNLLAGKDGLETFRALRQSLGRSILLGLEVLIAADIIRTVATSPTFQSIGVLAAIVLVRTFLSFSLEVELTGKWPWSRPSGDKAGLDDEPASSGDGRSATPSRRLPGRRTVPGADH